jgi:hypothetical protein
MPIQRSLRAVPVLLLTAVLAGCATTGANMPNANVPVADYRDTVEFSGALSVTYER